MVSLQFVSTLILLVTLPISPPLVVHRVVVSHPSKRPLPPICSTLYRYTLSPLTDIKPFIDDCLWYFGLNCTTPQTTVIIS